MALIRAVLYLALTKALTFVKATKKRIHRIYDAVYHDFYVKAKIPDECSVPDNDRVGILLVKSDKILTKWFIIGWILFYFLAFCSLTLKLVSSPITFITQELIGVIWNTLEFYFYYVATCFIGVIVGCVLFFITLIAKALYKVVVPHFTIENAVNTLCIVVGLFCYWYFFGEPDRSNDTITNGLQDCKTFGNFAWTAMILQPGIFGTGQCSGALIHPNYVITAGKYATFTNFVLRIMEF